MGVFAIIGASLTLFIPDIVTAFSSTITTMSNCGPGLAGVGAVENYAWVPIPAKWIMVLSMLLGRLEIFTVLIVLRVATWRK
jgi:trk system potassium uptake protein TrkH